MVKAKRNEFGSNWWAKKWNKAISKFTKSTRLQRGKTYARAGYVNSIDISKGKIEAEVHGSMSTTYRVCMEVEKYSNNTWKKIIKILSRKAIFSAMLLNGEMPENIEDAFEDSGVHLFPKNEMDLITSCSCPDSENYCKHTAAVHYMIGVEFDKDPFLLLKLRGMEKERILKLLREARSLGKSNQKVVKRIKKSDKTLEDFYREYEEFDGIEEEVLNMEFTYEKPDEEFGIIQKLGIPKFCTIEDGFEIKMREVYSKTAEEIKKYL